MVNPIMTRFGTIQPMIYRQSDKPAFFRHPLTLLFSALYLTACASATSTPTLTPVPNYDPFLSVASLTVIPTDTPTPTLTFTPTLTPTATLTPTYTLIPTRTMGPTPTLAQVSVTFPPTRAAQTPVLSPTPDNLKKLPTPRQESTQYTVVEGDSLSGIAMQFGVSVDELMKANGLTNADTLSVGQTLSIPAPTVNPVNVGSAFKIIPDSELIYGPGSIYFDMQAYIMQRGGYLSTYTEDVGGVTMQGWEIISTVAHDYSVNPRLLLALLEYRSKWVSNPAPIATEYPMGFIAPARAGLYHQLTWTANELNRGYYLWKINALGAMVLTDGNVALFNPTINAGSAGVQYFLGFFNSRSGWDTDISPFGLFQTYYFMFGNPFDLAVEPQIPPGLTQPAMQLPFEQFSIWSFTGGPHAGWDAGSAWAALDFGPPGESTGCDVSSAWVAAVADGVIVRANNGAVIQDLDNDGYEQTGWTVFYMHIAESERVQPGEYLFAGDRIGHPSCEGGISNAAHLHIARKYNGEWIAADGKLPFVLDGWASSGNGIEYDGYLTHGDITIEAWDGATELNQIWR